MRTRRRQRVWAWCFVLLVACDDTRRVEVTAPEGVHIRVNTSTGYRTNRDVAEVSVEVTSKEAPPTIALVPVPIPYQPVTAERP